MRPRPLSRRRVLQWAGGALLYGACTPAPIVRPHVVLVLVDQLRHDALTQWGRRLSKLGRQGVVFH